MKCPKCGTQIPDNTFICPKCGTNLAVYLSDHPKDRDTVPEEDEEDDFSFYDPEEFYRSKGIRSDERKQENVKSGEDSDKDFPEENPEESLSEKKPEEDSPKEESEGDSHEEVSPEENSPEEETEEDLSGKNPVPDLPDGEEDFEAEGDDSSEQKDGTSPAAAQIESFEQEADESIFHGDEEAPEKEEKSRGRSIGRIILIVASVCAAAVIVLFILISKGIITTRESPYAGTWKIKSVTIYGQEIELSDLNSMSSSDESLQVLNQFNIVIKNNGKCVLSSGKEKTDGIWKDTDTGIVFVDSDGGELKANDNGDGTLEMDLSGMTEVADMSATIEKSE